jgi:hypothetical protein
VAWWHNVSSQLHLFRWSGQVVTQVVATGDQLMAFDRTYLKVTDDQIARVAAA